VALLTALVSVGCATDFAATSSAPGTTFGRIYIDTPEVYSRERLVNDRFQQDAWLRARLEENPTQGLQGSMSFSRQSSTSLALAAGVPANAAPGAAMPGASAPQELTEGPIEQFRDVLAYREEVRSEMLENQLDDRHDIAGNTLYRLKFDATVVPLHDTSAYAMVEITVKGLSGPASANPAPVTSTESKDDWEARTGVPLPDWDFAQYLPGLDERTISLYTRSYESWVKDIDASKYSPDDIRYGPLQGYLDATEDEPLEVYPKQHCQDYGDASERDLAASELVARGVPLEYQQAGTYIEEVHFGDGGMSKMEVPLLCVQTGLANFIWDLRHRAIEIYTYAVTPKERVQRVYGDTLSAGNLGLSLGAEQNGLGAAFAHNRAREARANAIMRQPQLVGYSPDAHRSDEATMGWLIGPRYQVSDDAEGSVSFRHVPTQLSLTGVISVPSWWTELELVTRTYWLDENGRKFAEDGTALGAGADAAHGTESTIALPGDLASIAEVLDPSRREPQLEETATIPDELVACESGAVIIRGNQLWRSTVVTLGGRPANSISVLPHMKGVIASFDQVQPSIRGAEALHLWTSEGGVHVRDMKIIGPEACEDASVTSETLRSN
jgi:hypothetical protein